MLSPLPGLWTVLTAKQRNPHLSGWSGIQDYFVRRDREWTREDVDDINRHLVFVGSHGFVSFFSFVSSSL